MKTTTANSETFPPFAPAAGLGALMYHKIDGFKSGVLRRGLYVSPRSFSAQLAALRDGGFRSLKAQAKGTEGEVVITFDDGFANTHRHALPILREYGMTAVNFLVAGRIGRTNTWETAEGERTEPLMDEAQIRDWLAAGNEIGAHTMTHPHLTKLSPAEAREEITASKKALEDRFSQAVTDFAYPYGEFDEAVREIVVAAGFERAWTVNETTIVADADPFALPRFNVVVSLRRPLNLLRSLLPRHR